MSSLILPGIYVRLPDEPGWGIGQVQSVVGNRITVNFEHAGKRLINGEIVELEAIDHENHPPSDRRTLAKSLKDRRK